MGIRNKEYLARHHGVRDLYHKLKAVEDKYIDSERAEALGIPFSGMGLFTRTLFFSPNPRKESIVAQEGIDEDRFHRYPQDDILVTGFGKSREELRESYYNNGRFEALVDTYLDYADSQDEKCGSSSHNIMNGGPEGGQIGCLYRGPKLASVVTATGFTGSCHRVLVMKSSNNAEKNDTITVSELELLVSWMYGFMSAQTYALCTDGVRASKYHMIFPVIAISFLMPSHARVIQCYFDEGKLNIQSTPLYNFGVDRSEYSRLMDDFLKWIEPMPIGNTTLAERFRTPTVATAPADKSTTPRSPTTGSMETTPLFGEPSLGLVVRSGNTRRQCSLKPTSQQGSRFGPATRAPPSDENAPPSRRGR